MAELNPRRLPDWAEVMRQKYLAGEASVFVLYGNVFDRYLVENTAYSISDFLSEVLLKDNKERIYEISIDRGLRVIQGSSTDEKAALYAALAEIQEAHDSMAEDYDENKRTVEIQANYEAYKEFFFECFERLSAHYPAPSVTSDYDKSVIFDAIQKGEENAQN